jgi:phosphatidylserine/phosphatidylglycerophosphate/cardiolipin synthase-like enzyme
MQALLDQLDRSIADAVLTIDEKRALANDLMQRPWRIDQLRQVRNHAFDLVMERARDPALASTMPALVKWLAEVVKVLDQVATPVLVETEVWFSPGETCRDAIVRNLKACRKRMDICVFTIADDDISAAIIAAHARGVAVRIISDNDKRYDSGSDIARFIERGIAVAFDDSKAHMHHKFALFDARWLINGSFNWTRSASTWNQENLVATNDPQQLRNFAAEFESLWAKFA